MNKLEEQFQKEVEGKLQQARELYQYNPERFLKHAEKYGIAQWAKQAARRGQVSDGFERLAKAAAIELTVESTVVDKKYAELFTDEEIGRAHV